MAETTFDLHSLGWKAFQDLSGTVLREIWGQTVQHFSDSKDGGRDGAFAGLWNPKNGEEFSGQFTLQCKFTAKRDKHLALTDVEEELDKARALAKRGLATTYILITNSALSGVLDEKLREAFLAIEGIKHFAAYGKEWISKVILESPRLRMLVPRIYGLGDLSQIFDERAHLQAKEILSSMGNDLSKFVITGAYRRSAEALVKHGFVLLLGEPASGKSTIAAALAIAALDEWKCQTFKARNADDFVLHSNPNEPRQFFWIDDAFGPTQFEYNSTVAWNHVFPHMTAAIQRGARVVFTSRGYIYRRARQFLKESAFPKLIESQVVIHVEQLSKPEREQILYNHIKLGGQPPHFRSAIKPHLDMIASHKDFKPEIARRLSDPLFTKDLPSTHSSLERFVSRPIEHLVEVIRTLDAGSKSALAAVFMRGGSLPSPLNLSAEEQHAIELIGGTLASLRESLDALNESLVLKVLEQGTYQWRFKHPTIRDAFATLIAADSELLDIYLRGSPVERLLNEVSCGDLGIEGVKVIVAIDSYPIVLDRLEMLDVDKQMFRERVFGFLSQRCERRFLEAYLARHPDFIDSLFVYSYVDAIPDIEMIVALHRFGLLPEANRQSVVSKLTELAVETPDAGFLDQRCRTLLTDDERGQMLETVRTSLLPDLDKTIRDWEFNYPPDSDHEDPDEYFQPLIDALSAYQKEFAPDQISSNFISHGLKKIKDTIESCREDHPPGKDDYFYDKEARPAIYSPDRSIFDDVDK
jgi:hypothetical protein